MIGLDVSKIKEDDSNPGSKGPTEGARQLHLGAQF